MPSISGAVGQETPLPQVNVAELLRFTTRLPPTAEKPPPLAENCTWPGPLPRLRVKSPAASSTTPPSSVRLLPVGNAAELLSRRTPPETVVGPV